MCLEEFCLISFRTQEWNICGMRIIGNEAEGTVLDRFEFKELCLNAPGRRCVYSY